jgi:hypothetical protein
VLYKYTHTCFFLFFANFHPYAEDFLFIHEFQALEAAALGVEVQVVAVTVAAVHVHTHTHIHADTFFVHFSFIHMLKRCF